MVRFSESTSRILLVLSNLAACPEGKGAMLEGNAVAILVGKLREGGDDSEAARENCVAVLLMLCQGNMRFRGLASEVGAEEVLKEVGESGNGRVKENAAKILQAMRGGSGGDSAFGENAEAREWNHMLEATGLSRNQFQEGQNGGYACSSQF
ncbi:U-box domain-containing protein 41 [Raphanus sativus]|nr:U-box domain-containing protein 41 [Raphanus sativus]